MSGKWMTRLVCVAVVFTFIGGLVRAEESTETDDPQGITGTYEFQEEVSFEGLGDYDKDELFKAYVDRAFGLEGDPYEIESADEENAGARRLGNKLTGNDAKLYDLLVPEIKKVAAGQRTSTEFVIKLSQLGIKDKYSDTELGVKDLVVDGRISDETRLAVEKLLDYNLGNVTNAIYYDYPFEFFWYGVGSITSSGVTYTVADWGLRTLEISEYLTISIPVDEKYSKTGEPYTYEMGPLPARVNKAVSNAKAIVTKYKNASDYDKLRGYKNEICKIVNNNQNDPYAYGYNDPWQLIWVFDGDGNTNVFCEGYARAFQYLCDLTKFNDPEIYCICVGGTIDQGDGTAAHMWNVVHMGNGGNYLVDVTLTDGCYDTDEYFMKGYASKKAIQKEEFIGWDTVTYTTIEHVIKANTFNNKYTYYPGAIEAYTLKSGSPLYLSNKDYSPSTASTSPKKNLVMTNLHAVPAGKNSVRLYWSSVSGADGYLVYGQKNGKYGYVGMTKGTSYTDTKASDSAYNFYWVFPYYLDANDFMRSGTCPKYVYALGICPAVTNLKANGTSGKVTLSWTASSGADGYLVYAIRPGGKYNYIGMTTKGTTFADTKASKTDWTFYWVYPYHKDAKGNMVVGGTAKYVYSKAR